MYFRACLGRDGLLCAINPFPRESCLHHCLPCMWKSNAYIKIKLNHIWEVLILSNSLSLIFLIRMYLHTVHKALYVWGFLKEQRPVAHRLSWDLFFGFLFLQNPQGVGGLPLKDKCLKSVFNYFCQILGLHLLDPSSGRASPFAVDWHKTHQDTKSDVEQNMWSIKEPTRWIPVTFPQLPGRRAGERRAQELLQGIYRALGKQCIAFANLGVGEDNPECKPPPPFRTRQIPPSLYCCRY